MSAGKVSLHPSGHQVAPLQGELTDAANRAGPVLHVISLRDLHVLDALDIDFHHSEGLAWEREQLARGRRGGHLIQPVLGGRRQLSDHCDRLAPSPDFLPWRFTDACCRCVMMGSSCRNT
jgi:hypothetical protein